MWDVTCWIFFKLLFKVVAVSIKSIIWSQAICFLFGFEKSPKIVLTDVTIMPLSKTFGESTQMCSWTENQKRPMNKLSNTVEGTATSAAVLCSGIHGCISIKLRQGHSVLSAILGSPICRLGDTTWVQQTEC